MSTILRLHNTGNNTISDWGNSNVYGSTVINQIPDPTGATAKHEITSIPSPFARIDLVKQAFHNVVEAAKQDSNTLDGNTIFHKMVSDSLDVGELFFKSKANFSDRLKVVYWDTNNELSKLQQGTAGQQILGQTLNMYLLQDAQAYNFDKMNGFFILLYTGPGSGVSGDVIGATSPATMFFSIANDLSKISPYLAFNQDLPFDAAYNPLYKRDTAFVEYLFALRTGVHGFAGLFPELDDYLNLTFTKLPQNSVIRQNIQKLTPTSIANYVNLMDATGNNIVEVLNGIHLHEMPKVAVQSDFEISPSHTVNGKLPLVLPVEKGQRYSNLKLTSSKWDGDNPAPYKDTTEVSKRRLPQTSEQIPYLAISDFLEDRIIKMPYKLNSQAFFDANTEPQDVSYFLPLKDKFFEYFTTDDIINDRMIEFRKNSGGVKVVLHIPVKGGTIDYERIYFENCEPKIDGRGKGGNNDGGMVNKNDYFGFALMPNVRFERVEQANYRFAITSQDDKSQYDVAFYNSDCNRIDNVMNAKRNVSDNSVLSNRVYCIEHNNLEYIRISDGKASGVLLPKMKQAQSTSTFTFAVDFGTSNTHIVCKSDGVVTKTFDIEQFDKQIQLNSEFLTGDAKESLYQELCPELVGDNSISKFPMRSALLISKNIDWNKPHFALGESNFAFLYEKKARLDHNKIETNLKWNNSADNEQIIKSYIESLFFLMRNKAILNGGNLEKTIIFWTYPLSMTLARKNTFKRVWQEAYTKYFGNDLSNVFDINESVAPYYYYKTKIAVVNNIVTIDIGGGTSDVVIANHGEIQYITSFRFAADSVFGDLNEKNEAQQNGIVRQFKDKIVRQLTANNLKGIKKILENLEKENNSANIASLFFSLKSNKDLTDKHINIDFYRELQLDTTQKITFLLFYSAIIYHVALMMKAKGLDMPRHIGFSGNGSRVVKILTEDTQLLQVFTKKIFSKIYGQDYPKDGLTIVLMDNPKEATSIGAIMADTQAKIDGKKVILLGTDQQTFANSEMSYNEINNDINGIIKKIEKETNKFIDFVFSLNEGETSFRDSFGIDQQSIEIAKDICSRDIKTYAENKLLQKLSEVNKEDKVEETMFFYPLAGLINSLTDSICAYASNNPKK